MQNICDTRVRKACVCIWIADGMLIKIVENVQPDFELFFAIFSDRRFVGLRCLPIQ